jgi:hypothetical protein
MSRSRGFRYAVLLIVVINDILPSKSSIFCEPLMPVTVVAEQASYVTPSGGRHSSQATAATDQVSLDNHWWRASGGADAIYLSSFVTDSDCGRVRRVSSIPMAVSIVSYRCWLSGSLPFTGFFFFYKLMSRLQLPCSQGT